MEYKDYTLTVRDVLDGLMTLADAYEKASAGKAPNGFLFSPADAAACMKAAVHFIIQLPVWIPVSEQPPEMGKTVMVGSATHGWINTGHRVLCGEYLHWQDGDGEDLHDPTHWMELPEPPSPEGCD